MRVLGIETSCDETGIAIYDAEKGLVAHKIHSQATMHANYGGVVPELASRDHIKKVLPLIKNVLQEADMSLRELEGIAYTAGPGLAGALLVGAMTGRSLAYGLGIPAVGVHHMEGHLLAPMLEPEPPAFPFVALLVSGGHTQLVSVKQPGEYQLLGESVDDAVGEAFDKTAKLLGLGYPGGAALEQLAATGDPTRFHFPRPMVARPGMDFSFSGLKTFAANTIRQQGQDSVTLAAIARAFQDAVIETLIIKCRRALRATGWNTLVVAGGVSANIALRTALTRMAAEIGGRACFARPEFCTDNGAMIAYVGCQRLLAGERAGMQVAIYPRWPLTAISLCS